MGYSITVVDDSPLIREAIKTALKESKIPIINLYEATNGKDALEIVENHWVDIIFTDLHMPGMTGLELIEHLNDEPLKKMIPVAVVSSERDRHKIDTLEKLGVVGFIKKPFKPHELKDIIYKTIGEWNYVEHTEEATKETESDTSSDF